MVNKEKSKITIVGWNQAKEGFRFLHEGPLKECEDCNLFNVCMMNLEPKRVYEVIEVREKEFPCKFHEKGARVVRVVESDYKVAIERKYSFPGGIITYKPQDCKEASCDNYVKCAPLGLKKGDRGKLMELLGPIQCPLEHPLILVVFHRMAESP